MIPTHVILIPYYSEAEVARYVRIADHIESLGAQRTPYTFLLASSPLIEPSRRLYERMARIAPTRAFACPTRIFGYPVGPSVMFWDCMDYLANDSPANDGFALWLESDMLPVKHDWLDRLALEWMQHPGALVMGRLVPDIRRWRIPRSKLWIPQHINGGACYAKDFARQVPLSFRSDRFDLSVFPYLSQTGRYRATESIAFSTCRQCHRDMVDPRRLLLHGFLQDKDRFLESCLHSAQRPVRRGDPPHPVVSALSRSWRRLRTHFYRSRERAILETLLVSQEAIRPSGKDPALSGCAFNPG